MNYSIDKIHLNFDSDSLFLLNLCLALIMFGVALDLSLADFRRIVKTPKPALIGILSQFIVLPALTFLIILLLRPIPSIALGMMLVAACPGGNISNFMTYLAKGNTALSISLTAFSTSAAIIMTPLNLAIWGSFYEPTSEILREVSLNPLKLFETILLILGLPLVLGMLVRNRFPVFSDKAKRILKPLSMLIFVGFVVIALANNFGIFLDYFDYVVGLVFLHNALALTTGYSLASLFKLSHEDRKTLTIETGIQNSGLGLILIFSFFDGLGGMAIVAAWWGIWHIISGMGIGYFWSRKQSVAIISE
jgi:BASS family bile acid:Na+ symporter